MTTDTTAPEEVAAPAAVPSPKAPPENLTLRANPRRVVRFKRGVVIGGAAAGSLAVAGVAWLALGHHPLHIAAPVDQQATDRRTPADAVANLPGDYGKVPQLGPPLPGDLGKPILDRQRQLEAGSGATTTAPATMTPAEQAAEAERQRLAAQAHEAREAGVMVQASGRAATAPAAGADGGAAPAATPTDTAAADKNGKLDAIRTPSNASWTSWAATPPTASMTGMRCRPRPRPMG